MEQSINLTIIKLIGYVSSLMTVFYGLYLYSLIRMLRLRINPVL